MNRLTARLSGMLLCLALHGPATAQLSDSAQVSLITIGPGQAIYSLWGHSALRIYDPVAGIDIAYNYGTFDFDSRLLFMVRFLYGELDYALSRQDFPSLVAISWEVEGRAVVEQVLNLSPDERENLFRYLEQNARAEYRIYRYDYFFDNCSTRIRDALEHVLGDTTLFQAVTPTASTLRQLSRPYSRAKPMLDVVMNLALGLPADAAISGRERLFLPLELMESAGRATIRSPQRVTPLVTRTDSLRGSAAVPDTGTSWTLVMAWLLFALAAGSAGRGAAVWRVADAVLLSAAGLAGLLLYFLWLVSLHDVAGPNLHVVWAWPLHLFLALEVARQRSARWHRPYFYVAAATTALTVAVAILMPARNPSAAIPLLLLLSYRCAILGRSALPAKPGTAQKLVPRTGFEPVLPA